MSFLLDDIQLTAPAPNPVKGGQAQATGQTGIQRYYYWVVTHFPIGVSVSAPLPVINAPDVLSPANSILIVWDQAPGATSYDVLRTATNNFPQATGNFALVTGSTGTSTTDQGQALTSYNTAGLSWGAPVIRKIYLNNRDYSQPTIELDAIKVPQITFADGSTQTSASAAQTPWLSDINAAGHALNNASQVSCSTAPYSLSFNPNQIIWRVSGLLRWIEQVFNPETGGNTGSDFSLTTYDDTGAVIRNPILITRSTGNMSLVRDGGNVGIGTSTPSSRLSVVGLPTSPTGLTAGDIWIDTAAARVLKIV